MVFEGVRFYQAAFEKTEAEFIEHESHVGLSVAQLKEAYTIGAKRKITEVKSSEHEQEGWVTTDTIPLQFESGFAPKIEKPVIKPIKKDANDSKPLPENPKP